MSEVIERVDDDRLQVYLYNFPQMSALPWSPALVAQLITAYPDTLVGLKDSSGDAAYTYQLLSEHPGFAVFPSSETLLLAALRKGAAGCISATANTHIAGIRRLYDGWRGPDAEQLHEATSRVRQAVQKYPLIPAVKVILAECEGAPDWLHIRPPLERLNAKASVELIDTLKKLEAL